MDLASVCAQTLSPDLRTRKAAEAQLAQAERRPGFSLELLRLVEASPSTPQGETVRQASAVLFKNLVRRCWVEEDGKENSITTNDREAIKTHIVNLMCSVPEAIQRQVSESVRLIAEQDFPERWPSLLPDLVQRLASQDLTVLNGVLGTANAICKRFRFVEKSDALYAKLKYVLELLQQPLLDLFKTLGKAVESSAGDKRRLGEILAALRTVCRIFFSLNWQTIPEFFEDHQQEWMSEFHRYLTYENALLVDSEEEDEAGPIENLKAAVIENLKLYAEKYEEEFQPFLARFTEDIWNLLVKTGSFPKFDVLVATGIRFLTSVVSKPMHKAIFQEEAALRSICEKIIIPNIMFRETDQECFEVRGLCRNFDVQVTSICMAYLQQMLAEYQANPAVNWKAKDAAITLVIALAAKAQTTSKGVSQVNANISIMEFFGAYIVEDLRAPDLNTLPVLKADCIKFVSTFRNQFPKETMLAVLPLLTNLLKSASFVVHTYAAAALERILVMKHKSAPGVWVLQYGQVELRPLLEPLLTNLFGILDNPVASGENEYAVKAVMRIITVAKEEIAPVTHVVLDKLQGILGRVCTNPSNPTFNHYLFESIAALVKFVCASNPMAVEQFEALLFPPFQQVLGQQVVEFTPYVFQIMAQMLELRPGGPSPAYLSLFPPLLSPVLWECRGNVPALVRLLEAYLRKGAKETVGSNPQQLEAMLGVFQKLVASRATEDYAFQLLVGIIEFLPIGTFSQYLGTVFQLVLMRMQNSKTARFAMSFVYFLGVFIGKHGPSLASQALGRLQPGLFLQLMEQVWLVHVQKVAGDRDRAKACVVGMSRVMGECPELLGSQTALWGRLLVATMAVFEAPGGGDGGDDCEDDALELMVESGYTAAFSRLHFAQTEERDPLKEVPDAKAYFARALSALSRTHPGKVGPLVQEALAATPQHISALQAICQAAGVTL